MRSVLEPQNPQNHRVGGVSSESWKGIGCCCGCCRLPVAWMGFLYETFFFSPFSWEEILGWNFLARFLASFLKKTSHEFIKHLLGFLRVMMYVFWKYGPLPASSIRDLLTTQMEVTYCNLWKGHLKHPFKGHWEEAGTWQFFVTFLGCSSDLLERLSDLQLGDKKVTLNHHLVDEFCCCCCCKIRGFSGSIILGDEKTQTHRCPYVKGSFLWGGRVSKY